MDFQAFTAAIFDLDGTLLDSMGVWHAVDAAFLARRGIPYPPDYAAALKPLNYAQAAAYTKQRFELPESEEAIIQEWDERVRTAYESGLPLKPGAADFLHWLKASGVKIGLATASSQALYEAGLKANGVYDLFDAFATLDEPNLRGKKFPDIYLRVGERLGAAPTSSVVFEDILDGICGAKAGGMKAVGIYDACSEPEKAEIIAQADAYYMDYTEIERPE
ncbi:MAG: HAD family phosphatase [Ethanoligenens sp.]